MGDKEILMQMMEMLSKLSQDDINKLLSGLKEDEQQEQPLDKTTNLHTIKRRGKGHSKQQSKITQNSNKKNKKQKAASKGKACRTSPINLDHRQNKFDELINNLSLDSNEQKELVKAKQEDDMQRSSVKSFKKSKRKSNMIDVTCCVCKDEYTVSAALVHDVKRWKCNTCSCSAG